MVSVCLYLATDVDTLERQSTHSQDARLGCRLAPVEVLGLDQATDGPQLADNPALVAGRCRAAPRLGTLARQG